ncbi:unnamed protein product, partial [Mesorhabditis spiculigera]
MLPFSSLCFVTTLLHVAVLVGCARRRATGRKSKRRENSSKVLRNRRRINKMSSSGLPGHCTSAGNKDSTSDSCHDTSSKGSMSSSGLPGHFTSAGNKDSTSDSCHDTSSKGSMSSSGLPGHCTSAGNKDSTSDSCHDTSSKGSMSSSGLPGHCTSAGNKDSTSDSCHDTSSKGSMSSSGLPGHFTSAGNKDSTSDSCHDTSSKGSMSSSGLPGHCTSAGNKDSTSDSSQDTSSKDSVLQSIIETEVIEFPRAAEDEESNDENVDNNVEVARRIFGRWTRNSFSSHASHIAFYEELLKMWTELDQRLRDQGRPIKSTRPRPGVTPCEVSGHDVLPDFATEPEWHSAEKRALERARAHAALEPDALFKIYDAALGHLFTLVDLEKNRLSKAVEEIASVNDALESMNKHVLEQRKVVRGHQEKVEGFGHIQKRIWAHILQEHSVEKSGKTRSVTNIFRPKTAKIILNEASVEPTIEGPEKPMKIAHPADREQQRGEVKPAKFVSATAVVAAPDTGPQREDENTASCCPSTASATTAVRPATPSSTTTAISLEKSMTPSTGRSSVTNISEVRGAFDSPKSKYHGENDNVNSIASSNGKQPSPKPEKPKSGDEKK